MNIGIIGCGFIGSTIAKAVEDEIEGMTVVALCDIDTEKAEGLQRKLTGNVKLTGWRETVACSDLIVEAASHAAVKEILAECRRQKKDLLVMSVGGLLGVDLKGITECKVYIPSGAIGGLDALQSAREKNIQSVTLTTTKSPRSLGREDITKKTTVFEGTVREAIQEYPKNVNVAATLALIAGEEKVKVRVICDPAVKENTHDIHAKGDFGEYQFTIKNMPSPENPKTSYLAALSAVNCLKKINRNVRIG